MARVALFLRAGMPNVVRNEEDKIIRRIAKLQLPDGFDKPSGEEQWQVMAQGQEMKQMSLQACAEEEITTVVAYAVMEGNFPLTI